MFSVTKSWSVISVCNLEKEEFLGCHMAGNIMCFRSGKEDRKIPGSVADSSGHHITPKSGSDLGPWNFSR